MLCSIAFWLWGFGKTASSESCPTARSIYRDAEGKGLQLVFGAPPTNSAIHGTATIVHPQQGQIYHFNVTQSSGYGSIWLWEKEDINSENNDSLWLAFFDGNLKLATPTFFGEETESPQYAIIAELGSYDYYQKRMSLGDVIWIHDRCQSDHPQNR
jgi:hypothetical protein